MKSPNLGPDPLLSGSRPWIAFDTFCRKVMAQPGFHPVVGASGSVPSILVRELLQQGARRVLYVAPNAKLLDAAFDDLNAWLSGIPIRPRNRDLAPVSLVQLPTSDTTPYAEAHIDRALTLERAAALYTLATAPRSVVVTSASALVRKVPPQQLIAGAGLTISKAQTLDLSACSERLERIGYLRTPLVEDAGTFAIRGGILDIWPALSPRPARVELDGESIVSIKFFHPEDQRTLEQATTLSIAPARLLLPGSDPTEVVQRRLQECCDAVNLPTSRAKSLIEDVLSGRNFLGTDGFLPAFAELGSLTSYLARPQGPLTSQNNDVVVFEDPAACLRELREELERAQADEAKRSALPHFPVADLYVAEEALAAELGGISVALCSQSGVATSTNTRGIGALEALLLDTPSLRTTDHAELILRRQASAKRHAQPSLDPIISAVRAWFDADLKVMITARSEHQRDRLEALFTHRELAVVRVQPDADPSTSKRRVVHLLVSPLARGLCVPSEEFVVITEEEIFGTRTHRADRKEKRSPKAAFEDLRALAPGDYVVHVEHGIGRYAGLVHRVAGGILVDLLAIEYEGKDKLYVPVYRLNLVQKYAAGEHGSPKLDRLGGASFAKTKAKVKKRVRDLADHLLALHAERAQLKKPRVPPPGDEYTAFEATFPFDETPDQRAAIADVLADVGSERVMDRLVCGDVGFGKTEVALRATFLHAMAGHQVAILCPTTVLAQQHFTTFSKRLADTGLEVRALSRFQSKKESAETLLGLKKGTVDVLVGTHRLLSRDVHFKNLGLLVVDEEQRFGVVHKERIKSLRSTVDVLTLSATPIPRTLQMALGGLRDLSTISTPPVDRRSVRTIVARFDDDLVREAIERELSRGGQIFFVYNRIEGLYERADRLKMLVPEARIAVAHGQMGEAALEKTMLGFVRGDYDVLASTAIIESGLDIPRANTLLIDRADLFGLSQLYQLRGRVGRSSERAYCYLLVPPPSQMTEEARLRVDALERHTELGSGLQVAKLDMEIRGTGELLGAEQSGFVESVGFDLFCEMLDEATRELKGEHVVHAVDPELSFDVDALLPAEYVSDVGLRLSLYKRLSSALDEADVEDLAREIEDRFGRPPPEARRLLELMRLKTYFRDLRVLSCEASKTAVTLRLREDTPLDPQKLMALVGLKGSPFRLTPEGRLTRRAQPNEILASGLTLAGKVLEELLPCVDPARAA
ncbi:MAG: transcription-repair coupling factor [Polyangiaceae bacterium]|nr:transcription-repair coupling factor [Polyangiaceae bacterium]